MSEKSFEELFKDMRATLEIWEGRHPRAVICDCGTLHLWTSPITATGLQRWMSVYNYSTNKR